MKPSVSELTLSREISVKVEEKISKTAQGIEEMLKEILSRGEISFEEVQMLLKSLEPSFSLLSQKWVLEILYALLIKGPLSFNELKKIIGANSRSLSLKLKALVKLGYVEREVSEGPPLKTTYRLTDKGKYASLLSLPLLYYIAKTSSFNIDESRRA